jgi:phage shock protein PspC (stress-responsive transcriptional regulator)
MASYCAGCGASLPGGANFCSTWKKAIIEPGPIGYTGNARAFSPLVRPLTGRKVAGVCQGIANQFGWDVTLVRVFTALLGIFTFPIAVLVYLLMWLIVPEEARAVSPVTTLNTTT